MNTPLVSVILPTYNTAEFIEEAVESILNQTYQNIELIVIDDGSTDNTREILEKYVDNIVYVYQENRGPSEARNTGISMSHGDLIAYQDADDTSLPNRIEKEVEFLLRNSKISLVCTGMVNVYEDGSVKHHPATHCDLFSLLQANCVICASTMHWKNVFDKVGMWNENVDWDLWIRISEKFQIGYIPDCLYHRRKHKHNISTIRGRLKNRLIDLQMFENRYKRKKEIWIAFKIKRISIECKLLRIIRFKNKRLEVIFWYGFRTFSNMIEKMIYIIEREVKK